MSIHTLQKPIFETLPLGDIKASGWLLEQLQLQADGLTGHLESLWADVGSNSAWLGGTGEDWERGPYYLDGLIPLAHILEHSELQAKALVWVRAILASQREDGFFGPSTNNDWWTRMVALKALTQHFDASADARVIPFMQRYFKHQTSHLRQRPLEGWGQARGTENIVSVLWLYAKTQEAWLLELAQLLLTQTLNWDEYLNQNLIQQPAERFSHFTHVVNVAMGLKYFALQAQMGQTNALAGIRSALAQLDYFHGMVNGMFSGDEWLAGLEPQHGVETCAVVETMFSLEQLIATFGHAEFADRLEVISFNALAAAMAADMRTHQYHQQVNQVLCTVADRDWTYSSADTNTFGLEPHFGCCTANLHQGWAKLVRHLWMKTPSGGLAAVVYAPNTLSTSIAGILVRLETTTNYPFEETIKINLQSQESLSFALELRIPAWCAKFSLKINGQTIDAQINARGFLVLERTWHHDSIELYLEQKIRRLERQNGAVGLRLGAITLAFSPGEIWTQIPGSGGFGDFEVRFRRSWNYALEIKDLDPNQLEAACRVERHQIPSPPFSIRLGSPPVGVESVALKVFLPARLLKNWQLERHSAGSPPSQPTEPSLETLMIPLVPYGSARIRIAEFPVLAPEKT